jgi:fumarylpyruvate hydrolase
MPSSGTAADVTLHHEIELVAAIGARGVKPAPADARGIVYGFAVRLDMTRRDPQDTLAISIAPAVA